MEQNFLRKAPFSEEQPQLWEQRMFRKASSSGRKREPVLRFPAGQREEEDFCGGRFAKWKLIQSGREGEGRGGCFYLPEKGGKKGVHQCKAINDAEETYKKKGLPEEAKMLRKKQLGGGAQKKGTQRGGAKVA